MESAKRTMTLADFNNQIVRPMTLKAIENGQLDYAIQDIDCQDIIDSDDELLKAVNARLKVIYG